MKVKVKFYSNARKTFLSLNGGYRPHFVVSGDAEMLGIEFIKSALTEYDEFGEAVVKLLYDSVKYTKLRKGVEFNIVEGARTVGEGVVIE